jgi:hypothetical protein
MPATTTRPRPSATRPRPSAPRPRRRSSAPAVATAGIFVIIAAIVAMAMLTRPDTGGLEPTGETNDMGMPVVTTPGAADGAAAAGGVEVTGANWAMGTVPLNVSVQPTWTLRNTSDAAVTLGEPHPEVREGCCPGPLTLGADTLQPGESTTLTFDLSMHEGMDGWHDIAVHVPVDDELLTLAVTGDFRS